MDPAGAGVHHRLGTVLTEVDHSMRIMREETFGPVLPIMAVDSLDPCGVYFGTTGGQVYVSANAGDSWAPIVRDLPSVVAVEVQTLP